MNGISWHHPEMKGSFMVTNTANLAIPSQNERLKIFLYALLFVAEYPLVFIVG
jgi:hypothetical protein